MGSAFWGRRDCNAVAERLEEYLEGTMPEGEERRRIAAHLADCPSCRALVDTFNEVHDPLSLVELLPVPDIRGDWHSVRSKLETGTPERLPDRPLRQRPWFGGKMLAGVLATSFVGSVAILAPAGLRGTPEPSPTPSPTAPMPPGGGGVYGGYGGGAVSLSAPAVPESRPDRPAPKGLLGYVTVGKGGDTLMAAPAFIGTTFSDTVPLVVEVGNEGEARAAELTVHPLLSITTPRTYRYQVTLAAHGISRFKFYPSFGGDYDRTIGPRTIDITLTAGGRRQSLNLWVDVARNYSIPTVYIGDRIGVLTPLKVADRTAPVPRYMELGSDVSANYVVPENAPDQTVGYNGIDYIVLSGQASRLSQTQWRAIREWVVSGGRLLLTDASLLSVPEVAEIAPVRAVATTEGRRILQPIADARVTVPNVTMAAPTPDAKIILRRLGVGTVLFTTFDPTSETYRVWPSLRELWQTRWLPDPSEYEHSFFEGVGHERGVWGDAPTVDSSDPFHLALPSVQFVLLLFLGYFILVVPVTFVVLKHRRQLNLAWVTGPVFAVIFTAGIFLIPARLSMAPTARRTTGVLFVRSGERHGRFAGYTELFFPYAGRYDISLDTADYMEMQARPEERERPLDTIVNVARGGMTARMSVNNLAFRRLHHEQSVTLAGQITADISPDSRGGLTGFVENDTGKPLLDAVVARTTRVRRIEDPNSFRYLPLIYRLGTLPPGRTLVHLSRNQAELAKTDKRFDNAGYRVADPTFANSYLGWTVPRQLTLMAKTTGADYGPNTGRDFSGERSVTVVVGLSTQMEGGKQ